MTPRFLFGPESTPWADDFLGTPRDARENLIFDLKAPADVVVSADDSWEAVQARFPEGWQPDAIALYLQYRHVPAAIWAAPVPIIGLAGDWNLQWHAYRRVLRHCDLVLTDAPGVEVMRREGIANVRAANLYGLGRCWIDFAWPDAERDIDVLFVGNFNPAVQRERLPFLARLADLRPHWNVVIASGVFGDDYRKLAARARIMFNHSIRGEWNCRAGEAIAAGALLFQESANREVPLLLKDRDECVIYDADNLRDLLTYYLEHEDERKQIALKARQRLPEFTFSHLWDAQRSIIAEELPKLHERAERRHASQNVPHLRTRTWIDFSSTFGRDTALTSDLHAATDDSPRDPHLRNALGVLASQGNTLEAIGAAAQAFQEAWQSDPRHVVAGLNLAEILLVMGQGQFASVQARRTLLMLDEIDTTEVDLLDAPHAARAYGDFRVEWERAAWANADEPDREARAKIALLRWRLHRILAELHDDVVHGFIACSTRPDLPVGLASLGCSLARKGRLHEAISFLRQAVEINPFDLEAARALFEALRQVGLGPDQVRLARMRRNLSEAAPGLVTVEPWHARRPAATPLDSAGVSTPLRIVWHGSQDLLHSLALVNREICIRLIKHGHELSLQPALHEDPRARRISLPPRFAEAQVKKFAAADLHVSHQWPPNFAAPANGHWVIMQPWEFGSLPRAWVGPMSRVVDEIWVPSHYVRDCFIRSGVPADRVHVVPNGVSDVFLRDGHSLFPLKTSKRFKFLFVGGTIERKGIDILLKTYGQTFSDKDDVCLVIKDMGVGTFYQGQTAEPMIERFRQALHAPEIEYLNQELNDEEMAGLYCACDCLVHPYRGEGFGLPIAEAMASGLPVIVTGYGAALDFCNDENAYLLPAGIVQIREKRIGDLETVDHPWLADPDQDVLRHRMRYVATHLKEAKIKGRVAQDFIRKHFTWDHTGIVVEQRLQEIHKTPIRRQSLRYEPAPTPAATAVMPSGARPRVSLTMIVKNEEHNLPACLQSVADLVNQIIIVDTGSTDATKQIALKYGAKVFDFPWIDHFAAARNEALKYAAGEWIFWMDADDRLDDENRAKLREVFTHLPDANVGFVMKCHCLPGDTGKSTIVDHIRLFRNHPQIRWEYRVHEQILPAIRRLGGDVRWSDVRINHVGYQNSAVRAGKLQRDLRLLTIEYEEQPNDPFTLFNLAHIYQEQGKIAETLEFSLRSLKHSHPDDSIVRKLFSMIIQSTRSLKRPSEALQVCEDARRRFPDDLEILCQEALTRHELGDRAGAIACFRRALDTPRGQHFASVDTGLQGYTTRHNLAVVLKDDGQIEEAVKQWELAIKERPQFLPALVSLADIHLKRQDWPALDSAIAQLQTWDTGRLEAGVFQARKHLAEKNFTVARLTIEQTIACYPGAIWPREVLTHILLQEGRDIAAAEKALRDVLTLDPNDVEARRNLEILLREQQR